MIDFNDPLYKEICENHASYLLSILEKEYVIPPSRKRYLYQYTKMESLCEGILGRDRLQGKEINLRATSLGYMNDPYEMISGIRFATFVLQNVFHVDNLLLDGIISEIRRNIFVTCFSTERDSLPMWNMYGNNGHGVSLLFDAKSLCESYSEPPFRCVYDEGVRILRLLKKWQIESLAKKNSPYNTYKNLLPHGLSVQTAILTILMLIVKNKYYKHENEVRIIVNDDTTVKFRNADNLIIPFKDHYLPKEALHEIIIGPCNDPIRTKESVEQYLLSLGMEHVLVSNSFVPYQII